MSLRDTIANAADLDHEVLPVDEWGVELDLRQFDLDRRCALIEWSNSAERDADGNLSAASLAAWNARVVIASAHDPATGEPVFTDGDVAMLASKNGVVVSRIAGKVLELNGMAEGSVDEGKDDSSPTLAFGSSTD